jgi:hypothetical protein
MNWNKISLFKMPKEYRRFEFTPRYYDARKEALDKKIAQYEAINNPEAASAYRREISFRANAGDRWKSTDFKAQTMRSNIRLLIILGAILFVFYLLFNGLDFIGPTLDVLKK